MSLTKVNIKVDVMVLNQRLRLNPEARPTDSEKEFKWDLFRRGSKRQVVRWRVQRQGEAGKAGEA